jgi:hypothetical protein
MRPTDGQLVCPHCQTKGFVTTKQKNVLRDLLGWSQPVFPGGRSRQKNKAYLERTCSNCRTTWEVR